MIRNELVGIAILTYKRPQTCYGLIQEINKCKDVDYLVVVKDKYVDYEKYDPSKIDQDHFNFIQIEGQHNIAYNKNQGIKHLLNIGCQHIFVIEDDVVIKDISVFEKYIDTAKEFNLGHLNWNTIPEVDGNPTYEIVGKRSSIDITLRVCGSFSYFTRAALMHCGLIDEVNFYNAFEHAEHAYRMAIQKFTTPFYAFADIHNAFQYLSNVGEGKSTLDHDSNEYKENVIKSANAFKKIYGKTINQIPIPAPTDVRDFLISLLKS